MELKELHGEVLHDYETRALSEIEDGGYGAIDTDHAQDGYYLIRWVGEPYALDEPTKVEGCPQPMPKGTMVCNGKYLTRLTRSPHWFYQDDDAETHIFRLQYIVAPDITTLTWEPESQDKPSSVGWKALSQSAKDQARTHVMKVPINTQDEIKQEIKARAKMEHIEVTYKGVEKIVEEEEDTQEIVSYQDDESSDEEED
jgi:hypothetical protein